MRSFRVAALSALVAPALLAHPGHGTSVAAGLAHPVGGLDHLLAMVAVGLLGARCGGRARWLLPLGFVTAMVVGGALAAAGLALPAAESVIALSVLVLGALVALAQAPRVGVALAIVCVAALAHGHAHVAEMASGVGFGAYAVGFVLATAALHALGLLGGVAAQRLRWEPVVRWSGAAIAAVGALLVGAVVG